MAAALDLQALTLLTLAATRCGSDLEPVLKELGIEMADDGALFRRLPLSDLARIMQLLDARSIRGHFPFAMADVFNFDGQPAVSAFLASAKTLRNVSVLLDWVPTLIHPSFRFDGEDDGNEALLTVHVDDPDGPYADHPVVVELIAAFVARVCRSVHPEHRVIKIVAFAHDARAEQRVYETYFGCPVTFGNRTSSIVIDSRMLDAALPGSLPAAHARAEEDIRLKLLGDGISPPVAHLVEAALRQRLELFGEGIEAVSTQLHMHPRALQRKLRSEGIGYAELVAKTRYQLASDMLRSTDLDIESIGLKLGYAERRSFTAAFQKWRGQTPSSYRKAMRRQQA